MVNFAENKFPNSIWNICALRNVQDNEMHPHLAKMRLRLHFGRGGLVRFVISIA